ncbi:STM4504/CBY_0614 family protein [Pseudomonas viridiflava]|uniref:STM4504/CBY_0614 family protein n=1 Tax=Pseudomonas viridiflava TaxID=33069 RepID=UPI0012DCE0DA|nr:hypothetical protein [Pseudomonas viridiflava]
MAIHEIYSKRKRRLNGGFPDVYVYDDLPKELRNQIVFVINDLVRTALNPNFQEDVCAHVANSVAREWGQATLIRHADLYSAQGQIAEALLKVPDTDRCLDIIEFLFNFADNATSSNSKYTVYKGEDAFASCAEELNHRFKENGVGYEYLSQQIVRIDSQLLHAEVVKPAVSLLDTPGFEGPQEEFHSAHEHYRHKRYKEALNDSLKSLESTMKAIAEERGFPFKKGDTAKKLILICMEGGLFPIYYQSHLSALANLFEGGVPSIRNNEGGHGQGATVRGISPHVVAYTLHMTASAIVLLINSHLDLPVVD